MRLRSRGIHDSGFCFCTAALQVELHHHHQQVHQVVNIAVSSIIWVQPHRNSSLSLHSLVLNLLGLSRSNPHHPQIRENSPDDLDDEEQPMRTMPISRGSLIVLAPSRVERSLRGDAALLPDPSSRSPENDTTLRQLQVAIVEPRRASTSVGSDSPTSALISTSLGADPPHIPSLTSAHAASVSEPRTVLAVLRELNRCHSCSSTSSPSSSSPATIST